MECYWDLMVIEAVDKTVLLRCIERGEDSKGSQSPVFESDMHRPPHVSAAFVPTSPLGSPCRFEGPKEEMQSEQRKKERNGKGKLPLCLVLAAKLKPALLAGARPSNHI